MSLLLSTLSLLFQYLDVALRTLVVVTTVKFVLASVSYPKLEAVGRERESRKMEMRKEREKKRGSVVMDVGRKKKDREMRTRRANGLLTPHTSPVGMDTSSSVAEDSTAVEHLERREVALMRELADVRRGLRASRRVSGPGKHGADQRVSVSVSVSDTLIEPGTEIEHENDRDDPDPDSACESDHDSHSIPGSVSGSTSPSVSTTSTASTSSMTTSSSSFSGFSASNSFARLREKNEDVVVEGSARVYGVRVTDPSWGVGRTSGGMNVAGGLSTSPSWTRTSSQWTSGTAGMRTYESMKTIPTPRTTTPHTPGPSRAITGQAIVTPSSSHARRTSSMVLVGSENDGSSGTPHVLSKTPFNPARGLEPNPELEIPPVGQPIDRDPSNHFVFFDMETTAAGIPYPSIRILELALCVTDKNFVPLDKGERYLVHWRKEKEGVGVERGSGYGLREGGEGGEEGAWMESGEVLKGMSEKVRQMHESSGLLTAYFSTPPTHRLTLPQVESRVIAYLARHHIHNYAVMAGAGIGFDRGMVACHMPNLDKVMNYQTFDTTTLWHLVRRKYNRTKRFSVPCAHRAMDDIVGSMHEARTYAELLLKHPSEVKWPSPHGI